MAESIISKFINDKKVAIVGVSRNPKKFGHIVFTTLKSKGYEVYAVNPNSTIINDSVVYESLNQIDNSVKNIIVVTNRKDTENIVNQIVESKNKFENVWIHQGSETDKAIEMLENHKINYVKGQCILMYTEPNGIHKFHQVVAKWFGMYKN